MQDHNQDLAVMCEKNQIMWLVGSACRDWKSSLLAFSEGLQEEFLL